MPDCPICTNALRNGATARLPCNHVMCRTCAENWFRSPAQNSHLCPMCRHSFSLTFGGGAGGGHMPLYIIISIPGRGLGSLLEDDDL